MWLRTAVECRRGCRSSRVRGRRRQPRRCSEAARHRPGWSGRPRRECGHLNWPRRRREFWPRLGGDRAAGWGAACRREFWPHPGSDLQRRLLSARRSGMARSRVELFEQIRRDRRAGGSSIRELADRHQCAPADGAAGVGQSRCRRRGRRIRARPRPAIGPVGGGDRRLAGGRPGRAAQAAAHGAAGLAAAGRRARRERGRGRRCRGMWPAAGAELGLDEVEVTVPQAHAPGAEAEVDFGEFHALVAGVLTEAVDVRAAAVVLGPGVPRRVRHPGAGGVPGGPRAGVRALRRGARPDPLRQPQAGRGAGAEGPGPGRVRAVHRAALATTGSTRSSASPASRGAHEKGGVEGEVGRFRRRHLVPVPQVASLAELNELIAAGDLADDAPGDHRPAGHGRRGVRRRAAHAAAAAGRAVRPGPAAAGPGGQPGPGLRAAVLLLGARPAIAGRRLRGAAVGARAVEVLDGAAVVARHERAAGKVRRGPGPGPLPRGPQPKPGALPGATALAQARAAGAFTAAHQRSGTRPAARSATRPAPGR